MALERRHAGSIVARAFGEALESAPAFERLGVELAGFDLRPHGRDFVSPAFAALGNLGPVVGALCRRRRVARCLRLNPSLDLGAPPGGVPGRPELALHRHARGFVAELDRAFEERCRVGRRPLRHARASHGDDGLGPPRPRHSLRKPLLELGRPLATQHRPR